jgi:two-component system, LytTR family, response regulator
MQQASLLLQITLMSSTDQYKCLVVDDERHAIELLSDYIAAIPQLYLEQVFQDPVAALMACNKGERYDFIFMDIDMPRLSGIELAQSLRPVTKFLVFTTAHQKYALDAFGAQADQYLLKPISLSKFALTIDQLLKSRESIVQSATADEQTFFIKSDQKGKFLQLSFGDVIAVEGLKNYVLFYTPGTKHIAYLTMKEAESALCQTDKFIRVHRSYIVAKKQIASINGRTIQLKNGLDVPIGESYWQPFNDFLSGSLLSSNR